MKKRHYSVSLKCQLRFPITKAYTGPGLLMHDSGSPDEKENA